MSTKNAQFGQRKKKHVQDDKCIDVVQDIKKNIIAIIAIRVFERFGRLTFGDSVMWSKLRPRASL